jgi:hypothetical protein
MPRLTNGNFKGKAIQPTATSTSGKWTVDDQLVYRNTLSWPFGISASGGSISYASGYQIHTFTSSGTFTLATPCQVDYIIVAGGGGGGETIGGGGGGGGVIEERSVNLSPGTYSIVVGNGGSGGFDGLTNGVYPGGSQGQNSSFNSKIAIGGGAGAGYNTAGSNGGSGGGGGAGAGLPAYTGTPGQGNNGGISNGNGNSGAGGGGAVGVGSNSSSGSPGAGGIGFLSNISGSNVYYGAGGGGGARNPSGGTAASGGAGGGGRGGDSTNNYVGQPGTANTGSGGGGGGYQNSPIIEGSGGNGGSGIVIVRFIDYNKDGSSSSNAASSASAIKLVTGTTTDGLYWISNPNINSGTPTQIYCDMNTDGGGWMLFACKKDFNFVPLSNGTRSSDSYTNILSNTTGSVPDTSWSEILWRFADKQNKPYMTRWVKSAGTGAGVSTWNSFLTNPGGTESAGGAVVNGGWRVSTNGGTSFNSISMTGLFYWQRTTGISEDHTGSDKVLDLWNSIDASNNYFSNDGANSIGTKAIAGYAYLNEPVLFMWR